MPLVGWIFDPPPTPQGVVVGWASQPTVTAEYNIPAEYISGSLKKFFINIKTATIVAFGGLANPPY
ncbi:MAG: hypothetical protein IKX14_05535, partial [Neisseriaceae bacterium]|nr:hypothetical protein [Neisseriaceae bacterium]